MDAKNITCDNWLTIVDLVFLYSIKMCHRRIVVNTFQVKINIDNLLKQVCYMLI